LAQIGLEKADPRSLATRVLPKIFTATITLTANLLPALKKQSKESRVKI
jgi:hypothetical protein